MQFGLQSTLAKKISRRYAQALFGLAKEKKAVEEIYADIVFLTETLHSSSELKDFVADPHYAESLLQSVIKELFENRVQPTTFDFLLFLIKKGRLNILDVILTAFTKLYQEEHKISKVEIVSAAPLTDEQIKTICKKLTRRFKKEFIAETTINATLIGGFLIKAGDQVLDYSMKNQLEHFRRQIINA